MGLMSVFCLSSTIFVFMQGGYLTTGSDILVDFSIPHVECDNSVFVDRDTGSVSIVYTWISSATICNNSSMKLLANSYHYQIWLLFL